MRTCPREAIYNYTTEVLTTGISETLADNTPIGISLCEIGTVEKCLNQTCSVIDFDLSPNNFSNLIVISFFPVGDACYPHSDNFTVYMGIDFGLDGEKFISLNNNLCFQHFPTCIFLL